MRKRKTNLLLNSARKKSVLLRRKQLEKRKKLRKPKPQGRRLLLKKLNVKRSSRLKKIELSVSVLLRRKLMLWLPKKLLKLKRRDLSNWQMMKHSPSKKLRKIWLALNVNVKKKRNVSKS